MLRTKANLHAERNPGNTHSQYRRQPRYFVGIDQMSTFRERIQEIYGDNPEITDAVSQLDEYFNARSFEDSPGVRKFAGRVRRSVDNPRRVDEVIAIRSRGRQWYEEISNRGKRFVIQGCTSIDKDTGRIGITIYRPGFDNEQVLAEEVYHVVFGILRQAHPKSYQAAQRWYESNLKKGADPTVSLDEAFSKSMRMEETGVTTGLPRRVARQARSIFSSDGKVPDSVMERVKAG